MEGLTAPLAYKGLIGVGLKKVKYRGAWDFLRDAFQIWRERVRKEWGQPSMWVVPVPLYSGKERWRGYNQAAMLAEMISKAYHLPMAVVLERTRETIPQYGLDKTARGTNVRGAFRVRGEVRGKEILLVDDVWTTGATMRECALALRRAGAARIWGAALAR